MAWIRTACHLRANTRRSPGLPQIGAVDVNGPCSWLSRFWAIVSNSATSRRLSDYRVAVQRVRGVDVECWRPFTAIHWGRGGSRLTAMIARWTLSSISGQSELWTTLTPFPRIRIVTWGCAPPCTTRESSNGPICLSVNLGASAHASSQMAGGSSAEHFSSLGALAERQQLSRRSKRDWDATIRPRRRCRHADCTQTGGGNPRRRITISRLFRGAP